VADERESEVGPEPSEVPEWPGGSPTSGRSDMAEQFEVDADAVESVEVGIVPIDIPTHLWKLPPPPPDPCACEVFAVRRPGINETPGIQGVRLARLGGGGVVLPPLAQLYLAPGSYVVSANATMTANLGSGGMVFAMLGTPGQGNLSWTWLTLPNRTAPGGTQIVHLECVLTITEADKQTDRIVGLDAFGGTADYQFLAYDIWLTAHEVGKATVLLRT
jgi:hypothetical protein